jgi:LmbE family N-acetylglucosaminyl deacetylase
MRSVWFCLGIFLLISFGAASDQDVNDSWPKDSYDANNRKPDERYKADLLVVVAHPDEEIMAAAFIAREVDQGKRVAIVWTTVGDGGTNEVGPEQARAMGDIREVEAMRGAASLGISNMWNLGGSDTPSQNPLVSLETCDHARCLGRLVRLVRLTRPEVILTWLPLGVTGENHGNHQASGVLATEAFDMAGDPTVFPEQITPASEPRQTRTTWKVFGLGNPRKFITSRIRRIWISSRIKVRNMRRLMSRPSGTSRMARLPLKNSSIIERKEVAAWNGHSRSMAWKDWNVQFRL